MKHILYLIVLMGISCLFSACSKTEEIVKDEYGFLVLDMGVSQPDKLVMTKAEEDNIDFDKFQVKIVNKENTPVYSFDDTFGKLKEQGTLRLPKGTYEVSVVQSGEMTDDAPFYSGKKDIEIYGNSFTDGMDATVICKMQQMRIQIVFAKDFLDALKDLPQNVCLKTGTTKEDATLFYEFKSWTKESDGTYVSNEIYKMSVDNLRLFFSAIEKEYEEPFVYDEFLKNDKGAFPVANDFWTVFVGLGGEQTKSLTSRFVTIPFTIKTTVR